MSESSFQIGTTVLAPIAAERLARQRFARIPFALAVMQQRSRAQISRATA